MKRITIILSIIIITSINSFSQDWIEFTSTETATPEYDLITSNDKLIKFEITIPGMYSTKKGRFQRINIKGHDKMDSIGYPELPVLSYLLAIPECGNIEINVSLEDSVRIDKMNIYPAPELVQDSTKNGYPYLKEKFRINNRTYNTDSYFTGTIAKLTDRGAIRAQHVIRVLIYPVKFNPVKKEIIAYSKIKITLKLNNTTGLINENVGIFQEVVSNSLINYKSDGLNTSVSCGAGYVNPGSWKWVTSFPNGYINDACDYLIITHQNFFNDRAAKREINMLAQHRANFNGFDVIIVKIEDIEDEDSIPGLNTSERIRNLIKRTYKDGNANHTYDGKLAYVNLFGDLYDDDGNILIQSYPFENPPFSYSSGYDVFFSQLTDSAEIFDHYPDIMLGRCSVDNTEQVRNIVHKILHFKPEELYYKDEMFTYIGFDNAFSTTESEVMFMVDDIVGDTYHKKLMLPPEFDKPFPDWDTIPYITIGTYTSDLSNLLEAYREGNMFVNYMDHGSNCSWYGGFRFDSLNSSHNHKLPFILSCACLTGKFQASYIDCMAEQFTCYDSIKGAIGFVGSSIVCGVSSFYLISSYFESLMRNYSSVLGEAIMETKIKYNDWRDDYNLFGDPALNIFYENTNTILPDLHVKKDQITIKPDDPNIGDRILIEAIIRNSYLKNANDTFYVSCYVVHPRYKNTIWLGNHKVNGLEGYSNKALNFIWNTTGLNPDKYEIHISIDTSNAVIEMNENNNMNYISKKICSYRNNYPVINSVSRNSYPVSFDLYANYEGEEIAFGENIITSIGNIITTEPGSTIRFTSIANLTNNQNYQVIQIRKDTLSVRSIGNPSWSYALPNDFYYYSEGPFATDIDNNGLEEILLVNKTKFDNISRIKLICLNYNGTNRWNYETSTSNPKIPLVCNFDESVNTIIWPHFTGKIYFIKENDSNIPVISIDSVQISNSFILNNPILTDLDKDSKLDLILLCYDPTQDSIDLITLNLPDTTFINRRSFAINTYMDPIVSDVNNDGKGEIILGIKDSGILILNHNLETITYIDEPNIYFPDCDSRRSELVSGDFDRDGYNDTVCQTKENDIDYYLRIFNYYGE